MASTPNSTADLALTAVLLSSTKVGDNGFTAYVQEMPQAVAQGKTIEDALANLQKALSIALKYSRSNDLLHGAETRKLLITMP